jgi:hypothetical protein
VSSIQQQVKFPGSSKPTSGKILWNFASGGSVIDGPPIVDGTLYWGSGYRNIPPGIGNNKVYAFSLASEKDRGEHSGR